MQASRESKARGARATGSASKRATGRSSKATTASEPSEDEHDTFGRRGGTLSASDMASGGFLGESSGDVGRRAGTTAGDRLTVSIDDDSAVAARRDEAFEKLADRCGQFESALAEKAMTLEHFDL